MKSVKSILTKNTCNTFILAAVVSGGIIQQANAAIALDRTRVVFDGGQSSVSLNISNHNKQLPYLAQAWIENEAGEKLQGPLVVLPPVQRVEPGKPSQIKIQALPAVKQLPQDRESLFYFNLREIPPKSDKPNTLQIALQTRIKLFYRPAAITPTREEIATPWQEKATLEKTGDNYLVSNPTPYFLTLVDAGKSKDSQGVKDFEPLMIPPKSSAALNVNASSLGKKPVLTYINDYGGRPQLSFNCESSVCHLITDAKKK
ncbi:fimbria/pilus periplasmic chaperone [Serratia ureilytica]|uniref:fimbria/pilus periplasmic chaperone n=1 Tax=Serratia ureilytica TaxID=300181 RepID=UPI0018E6E10E|nr:fimbria/pilus periplasmic chaperone [Serratia ureilytica]MBJ2099154.1 fimbria/pilus periplasmic chaperone [Serratia ureilytica]